MSVSSIADQYKMHNIGTCEWTVGKFQCRFIFERTINKTDSIRAKVSLIHSHADGVDDYYGIVAGSCITVQSSKSCSDCQEKSKPGVVYPCLKTRPVKLSFLSDRDQKQLISNLHGKKFSFERGSNGSIKSVNFFI